MVKERAVMVVQMAAPLQVLLVEHVLDVMGQVNVPAVLEGGNIEAMAIMALQYMIAQYAKEVEDAEFVMVGA